MPQPSAVRLGSALREATRAAGITQKQIAEAVERDQSTVSAWLSGENWAPLWALPIVDELCGQPRGHVLRIAAFVDDEGVDVVAAINRDPDLDEDSKGAMLLSYRVFVRLSYPSTTD